MYAVEDRSGIQRICSIKVPTVYTVYHMWNVVEPPKENSKFNRIGYDRQPLT